MESFCWEEKSDISEKLVVGGVGMVLDGMGGEGKGKMGAKQRPTRLSGKFGY